MKTLNQVIKEYRQELENVRNLVASVRDVSDELNCAFQIDDGLCEAKKDYDALVTPQTVNNILGYIAFLEDLIGMKEAINAENN